MRCVFRITNFFLYGFDKMYTGLYQLLSFRDDLPVMRSYYKLRAKYCIPFHNRTYALHELPCSNPVLEQAGSDDILFA